MTEQLRLYDLLKKDTLYRKWFMLEPKLRVCHSTPPWRLYVQKDEGGRWARVDIPSYAKALGAVKLRLPDVHDMTIHCKPQGFKPPVVRVQGKKYWLPEPIGHRWCMYCRRFTVFKTFWKHPNMPKIPSNPEEMRCLICGARAETMKQFLSPLNWPAKSAA